MVRPDPVQPRRVLPEQLHLAFHSSRLTSAQALKEPLHLVQVAARQRGRPFNNVLELLPNADDESGDEEDAKLSPEEQLLRDLVNLAVTIRDDGKVNPLTVVDVLEGVKRQFRIETGERRYWATWLLRDFIPGHTSAVASTNTKAAAKAIQRPSCNAIFSGRNRTGLHSQSYG